MRWPDFRHRKKNSKQPEKKSSDDVAASKKKFSAFLAKESTSIDAQSAKVVSDLAVAEKKELDRIDGKVPPKKGAAPVAKKVDANKQPQKARREMKEPRRLHKAVQKLSQKLTAKARSAGPVDHAKTAAAAKKAAAPVRKVARMPKTVTKPVGHLPAMRDATPAERRASAHKEDMKKLKAAKKQSAPLRQPARKGAPAPKVAKASPVQKASAAVPVKK